MTDRLRRRRALARAATLAVAGAIACLTARPIRSQAPPPPLRNPDTTRADSVRRDSIRVCAGGDVSLGTNLDTSWAIRLGRRVPALPDPDSLLAPLAPLFAGADLVLLNVEGAIGEGPANSKCARPSAVCYALRMTPGAAAAIRQLRYSAEVVGNVANNHAHDAGAEGFEVTRTLLEGAGVHVTGADTLPTIVVTSAGDSIAVLGFHTSGAGPDARDLAAVRRAVTRAVAAAPRVIVTMHLGAEGARAQHARNAVERFAGENRGNPVAFASAAIAAGADLVIGHGPHVLRGLEWRRGGDALVAYSLGNLLTYGAFTRTPPLDRGGVLCATLGPAGEVRRVAFRASRQVPPGVASPDPDRAALALVNRLGRADFPGSAVRFDSSGEAVAPDPAAIARADSARGRLVPSRPSSGARRRGRPRPAPAQPGSSSSPR